LKRGGRCVVLRVRLVYVGRFVCLLYHNNLGVVSFFLLFFFSRLRLVCPSTWAVLVLRWR
jgi:hypothetical protein